MRSEPGVRQRGDQYEVRVTVDGEAIGKWFALTSTRAERQLWRKQQKTMTTKAGPKGGTFWSDVLRFLPTVAGMPTYKQVAAHMTIWADALGRDRTSSSIKARDIDAIMQGWRTTPTTYERGRPSGPKGLDPQTIRKRRSTLMLFFVKLNGEDGYNPCRATWKPKAPKAEIRGTDYGTIDKILASMPDTLPRRKGTPPALNLGKLRVAVLAHTGLPPGILMDVTAKDLDWSRRKVRIEPREKGDGVEARKLSLTDPGFAAFRAFDAAHAYGEYSIAALNKTFQRHAAKVGAPPDLTLYDLRHSFGTLMYFVFKDDATVARFMLHAEGSVMTARYRRAANDSVDEAAAAAVSAKLFADRAERAAAAFGDPSKSWTGKLDSVNKRRKRSHLRRVS